MNMRLVILAGFVCAVGFANVSMAQTNAVAPAETPIADKTPQIAALTGQFHMLDTEPSNPAEIAPPGTVEDDFETVTGGVATDAPRRLQSTIR